MSFERKLTEEQLKGFLDKKLTASQIVEKAKCSIYTLQNRWAVLQSMSQEKLYVPDGLFTTNTITITKTGCRVPIVKLTEFGFEIGQKFSINFDQKSKSILLKPTK